MTLRSYILAALLILSVAYGSSQAAAAPMFSEASKQAVFLSPMERWMPTWRLESYVFLLERAGYHVDVLTDEEVSIAFLKTELAEYDLIILRTESYSNEDVNYYCSGEPVTSRSARVFANEIASGEVKVGICLGFTSAFLQHNYPADSLRHGLVYTIGSYSEDLSSAFLDAGASVFVTPEYVNGYSLQWGRMDAFSIQFFKYLSSGYTVLDATKELRTYLYTGHGKTADWPSMFIRGDQDFKI